MSLLASVKSLATSTAARLAAKAALADLLGEVTSAPAAARTLATIADVAQGRALVATHCRQTYEPAVPVPWRRRSNDSAMSLPCGAYRPHVFVPERTAAVPRPSSHAADGYSVTGFGSPRPLPTLMIFSVGTTDHKTESHDALSGTPNAAESASGLIARQMSVHSASVINAGTPSTRCIRR